MSTYPEHEKLSDIRELSQQLGSFLEWADNSGYQLSQWVGEDEDHGQWIRCRKSINTMLGEFYKIDLVKLEKEKEQMLEEMRKLHDKYN